MSDASESPALIRTRKERFVLEYLKDLKGEKAAIRAGFPPAGARTQEAPRGQAYLRGLQQALGRNPRAELDRARPSLEEELETYLD